jgi:hypothetical protein
VILLTAPRWEMDIKRAYDLGASFHLVNPVGFDAWEGAAKTIRKHWLSFNLKPGAGVPPRVIPR